MQNRRMTRMKSGVRPWLLGGLCALVLLLGVLAPSPLDAQEIGVSTGDGAWIWQNPRPQGNDLRSIRFVDASTGWSVGRHGVIMFTSDGGASWRLQAPAGVTTDLNGVAALD